MRVQSLNTWSKREAFFIRMEAQAAAKQRGANARLHHAGVEEGLENTNLELSCVRNPQSTRTSQKHSSERPKVS